MPYLQTVISIAFSLLPVTILLVSAQNSTPSKVKKPILARYVLLQLRQIHQQLVLKIKGIKLSSHVPNFNQMQ